MEISCISPESPPRLLLFFQAKYLIKHIVPYHIRYAVMHLKCLSLLKQTSSLNIELNKPVIVSTAERYSLNTAEHFSTAKRMYSFLRASNFAASCKTRTSKHLIERF